MTSMNEKQLFFFKGEDLERKLESDGHVRNSEATRGGEIVTQLREACRRHP